MNSFELSLDDITRLGNGLMRPECVAVTLRGEIWVSHALPDGGGGVARLHDDGALAPVLAGKGAPADFLPNGWSMEPDGSFLLANLGDSGGIWRLRRDGSCEPVLLELNGYRVPPVNFVHRDEAGRIWASISTCRIPRDRAFHRDVADGLVILIDDVGARVVADGIGYTKEVKLDPSGQYLYAHETMARTLIRYAIRDGALGPKEVIANYLHGVIPDGFEFDAEGGIWCASVMSNRLIRIAPDGTQHIVLEDCDLNEIDRGMDNWHNNCFTREDMNIGATRELRNIASITFGGEDLKTGYLGSLFGDCLFTFRSPIAGAAPPHWHF